MSIIQEFKAFALRGNVMDLAVGVIIGTAFGKIVASLVENVIMPPVGMLMGGMDFTNFKLMLKESVDGHPAVYLEYGKFIQTSLDFAILAFCIFMMVKMMNKLKKETPATAAEIPAQEKLLMEIRDLLKK